MHLFAWLLQVILAVQFAAHGRLFVSPPAYLVQAVQSSGLSPGFRQFLGVAEILAAVGLVLPALTRILPWLTSVTAACLMFVMVSATVYHVARGEWWSVMGTVNLLVVVALTGYLRWRVVPIHSRTRTTTPDVR